MIREREMRTKSNTKIANRDIRGISREIMVSGKVYFRVRDLIDLAR